MRKIGVIAWIVSMLGRARPHDLDLRAYWYVEFIVVLRGQDIAPVDIHDQAGLGKLLEQNESGSHCLDFDWMTPILRSSSRENRHLILPGLRPPNCKWNLRKPCYSDQLREHDLFWNWPAQWSFGGKLSYKPHQRYANSLRERSVLKGSSQFVGSTSENQIARLLKSD
jgi:hypothetical protein